MYNVLSCEKYMYIVLLLLCILFCALLCQPLHSTDVSRTFYVKV